MNPERVVLQDVSILHARRLYAMSLTRPVSNVPCAGQNHIDTLVPEVHIRAQTGPGRSGAA
jgi:hypothetical protein